MPRAPADARVKARPVVLVARMGRSTGCVAGSVVFVEDTDVATVARDDGVVDVVRTGSVSGDDDAIIVAVNHSEYANKDEAWFKSMLTPKGILVDLKGVFRKKVKDITYWSL
jgi:UDP-N-acetyl-D-mannosaminuronate dehydrogenase